MKQIGIVSLCCLGVWLGAGCGPSEARADSPQVRAPMSRSEPASIGTSLDNWVARFEKALQQRRNIAAVAMKKEKGVGPIFLAWNHYDTKPEVPLSLPEDLKAWERAPMSMVGTLQLLAAVDQAERRVDDEAEREMGFINDGVRLIPAGPMMWDIGGDLSRVKAELRVYANELAEAYERKGLVTTLGLPD